LLPDGLNNETIENLILKIEPQPNSCVCSQTTTKTISIIDSSEVRVSMNDINIKCPGQIVLLTPQYVSPNGIMFWNSFNSYNSAINYTSNTTDTLQVVISITDTVCGIAKIDVDTAYIYPPIYDQLNIVAPNSLVLPCLNSNLNFAAVVNGGLPIYRYWWYNANNVLLDTNINIALNVTQNSNFKLIVKDGCNKKDTLQFSVTETPRPEFSLLAADNITAQCPNQIINILASTTGGLPPYQYLWSNGTTSANYQTSITDTTLLMITAKDSCANERRKFITLFPAPYTPMKLSLIADTTVCPGEMASLSAQAANGLADYVYTFSTSSSNTFNAVSNNSIEASLTTSSFFKATCVDGCQNTIVDSIYIHRYADCNAHIRNVVVIDGQNGNKALYIDHVEEYPNTHVIIYNRWGVKVYENNNFTNATSWNAENADAGTFYYIIEFDTQYMYENNNRTGFLQVIK
jgi:CHU_C Type IX secretion signal domain